MEGKIKDVGSQATGTQRYRIPLGNLLRHRLGERHFIPVALSLFAVPYFHNHTFEGVSRSISAATACFLRRPGIIFCAALVLVCLTDRAHAVPVCDRNFNTAWYNIDSSSAGWDLQGYYSVLYRAPGWTYGNFNEGDNIEWIYHALENQYSFLDDTLYRIMGGSYLLGPVCYPGWHGFRYYYWVRDKGGKSICAADMTADPATMYMEQAESGDIITFAARHGGTGQGHSLTNTRDIPGWTQPGGGINVDAKAIPEPSTIALFGLAALQILRIRRVGGD